MRHKNTRKIHLLLKAIFDLCFRSLCAFSFSLLLTKLNSCQLLIDIECLDLCFTWTIYIEVFLTETILALNTCCGH